MHKNLTQNGEPQTSAGEHRRYKPEVQQISENLVEPFAHNIKHGRFCDIRQPEKDDELYTHMCYSSEL